LNYGTLFFSFSIPTWAKHLVLNKDSSKKSFAKIGKSFRIQKTKIGSLNVPW